MKATRTIAGRPINDGAAVAETVIELIAETLAASPHFEAKDVKSELAGSTAALALLAGGGHLRDGDLVLIAGTLRLQIEVPVGKNALEAEMNTNPPRGAATAEDWRLHLPVPDVLAPLVHAAGKTSTHVTTDPAPDEPPAAASKAVTVDLSRLREIGRV